MFSIRSFNRIHNMKYGCEYNNGYKRDEEERHGARECQKQDNTTDKTINRNYDEETTSVLDPNFMNDISLR